MKIRTAITQGLTPDGHVSVLYLDDGSSQVVPCATHLSLVPGQRVLVMVPDRGATPVVVEVDAS